jgi:hypothetical protein
MTKITSYPVAFKIVPSVNGQICTFLPETSVIRQYFRFRSVLVITSVFGINLPRQKRRISYEFCMNSV